MMHRCLRRLASLVDSPDPIRPDHSSAPALLHHPSARWTLLVVTALLAGACGGGDTAPAAEVAELTPMGGSTVQGQATASSRLGEVRVSLAVAGLRGPSTLRLMVLPGECPVVSGDAGRDPMADPMAGISVEDALARLQVTTEGVSGAGTLTFPAADLPPGGDIAILVRDFTGVPLACGEVSGLPVTELPEGAAAPAEPEAPNAPTAPDTSGANPPVDTGVSA